MDILCVFGRGIEQAGTKRGLVWKPARYIERLDPNTHGHSGFRNWNITPNDKDQLVVIAGATANALAAAHIYEELRRLDRPPVIVTFAAGRPAFLDNYPDMWEGKPLSERFLRSVTLDRRTTIRFQIDNRNTRDDLLETLRLAMDEGFHQIGIITVKVHIPRCQEFLRLALEEDPSLSTLEARLIASEDILAERHRLHRKVLSSVIGTLAYARTEVKEARGLANLKAGKYNFSSQGYSFAKKLDR